MMKNHKLQKANKLTNIIMLGTTIVPLVSSVGTAFADNASSSAHSSSAVTTNPSSKASSASSVDDEFGAKSGLTQVVSVNGHKLLKDEAVKAGDTVAWDVIVTPGNEGLMKTFTDTLPEYLKFNPDSKYCVTVYDVNNDGTIGKEITNDGEGKIDGKTYTWTPKTATNYVFVGSQGKENRLLFHITTKVVGDAPFASDFINHATLTTTHDKKTDSAEVHTPAEPKTPTIHKSVYAEDEKGNLVIPKADSKNQADLPKTVSQSSDDKAQAKEIANSLDGKVSTSMSDKDIISNAEKLIDMAKKHNVDVSQLSKDVDTAKGSAKLSDTQKATIIAEYKTAATQIEQVAQTLNSDSKTDKNATVNQLNSKDAVVNGNDSLDLQTHDSLYGYVVDVTIPAQSVQKSLVIKDPMEHVQTFSTKDVHIYDDQGKDITDQGTVTETGKGSNQVAVLWTAKDSYVQAIKKSNKDVHLKEVIKNVTLKGDNPDDEKEYLVGGRVTIPNVAQLITDGHDTPSNKTIVRPPADNEGPSTITKGVMLESADDSKKGNAPATSAGSTFNDKDPLSKQISEWGNDVSAMKDGASGSSSALSAVSKSSSNVVSGKSSVAKSSSSVKDAKSGSVASSKKAVSQSSTSLAQSSASSVEKTDKTAASANTDGFHAWFEGGKFALGQTTQVLPKHDSVYRYLINTSIRPDDVEKSLVIEDPMENVQANSVKAENVRVYDITGKDVTNGFTISVDKLNDHQVDVKATAKPETAAAVHSQHQNVQYQMVINHVSLKGDKAEDETRYMDGSGQVRVPNVAKLVTDKQTLQSDQTQVLPPKATKPAPKKCDNCKPGKDGKDGKNGKDGKDAVSPAATPNNPGNPGSSNPGTPGTPSSTTTTTTTSSPIGNIKTGLSEIAQNPWELGLLFVALLAGVGMTVNEMRERKEDK